MFQLHRFYNVELGGKMVVNLKGDGRGLIKDSNRNLPGGTK